MNIYHPHPHEITAKQVYHGLAGALFVHDAEEAALGLPSGEYEIPIVIQDRRFDDQNQLVYIGGMGGMHDRMMGYYGDRILVNGRPDFTIDVDSRAYRLRVLNGSTARIYKLGWAIARGSTKEISMNHIRPRLPAIVIILLLIAVSVYFLVTQTTSDENGALTASGTIEATTVNIAPELAGKVVDVLVEDGTARADGRSASAPG